MAKKGRKTSSHEKKSNFRRKIVFMISVSLIAFMLWSVLRSVQTSNAASENAKRGMEKKEEKAPGVPGKPEDDETRGKRHAFGKKGRICAAEGAAAFFSFCKVGSKGKGNSCAAGCTCEPFFKKGKWGVCKTGGAGGPEPGAPTSTPVPGGPTSTPVPGGGTTACGAACAVDSDCASGFCNPAGFPLCPTAAPGQPLEGCQLIPPDPTLPNVCAPVTCRADNTNPANCACPAAAAQPNNFIYRPKQ